MELFLPVMSPDDLEPEIVSIAVCRTLRIKRVGVTYFVECSIAEDNWKTVAISKPDTKSKPGDARREAHAFLWQANTQVCNMIRADMERSK